MTDVDDAMHDRIRNRKLGSDPVLEQRTLDKAPKITVIGQTVTKIETLSRTRATDSGNDEVTVRGFIEREAHLITISGWDLVQDKEHVMRSQIVPAIDKFGFDPKATVVLQFLDSTGRTMKHVASGVPKAVVAPG